MKRKPILTLTPMVAMIAAQSSCSSLPDGSRVDFHTSVKGVPVSVSVGK